SLHSWMYTTNKISRHERAAVLIQFARDGEEHSIFASDRGLYCFRLRTKLAPVFRAVSCLYALLKFFQRPLWTYHRDDWDDNHTFPSSGFPQLSHTVVGALKLPLLFVMMFGILLELGYKEASFSQLFRNLTSMRVLRYLLLVFNMTQVLMVVSSLAGAAPQHT
ncbi:hypothetical protein B484DRAFT_426596, partial [Ochromonadaceae sp. CCMP2298]